MTSEKEKRDTCKKCGGPKAYDIDYLCQKCFDKMVSNVKDASRFVTPTIEFAIVEGAGCLSLIINDFRITGPEAYGGGAILKKWTVSLEDLQRALENKFYIIRKTDPPENWIKVNWDVRENLRITWRSK